MTHQYEIEENSTCGARQVSKISCKNCGRSVTTKFNPSQGQAPLSTKLLKSMLDTINCEEAQEADVVES
jgi:hypothetical protein